jgi:RNA recognition motif-containing protein
LSVPFDGEKERNGVSKVFVGNLSFQTTREEVQELFGSMGEIAEVVMPLDRDSGRPRGFAFVTFATAESATQAIQRLDGAELGGRNLRVNEATAERPAGRPGGGGYGSGFGGGFGARPAPRSRPKGSRRNIRGRKRSIW